MQIAKPLVAAAAFLFLPQAQAGIGADVSAGTQGVSANAHFQVTPFLTLRGAYNFLQFEVEDQEFDGVVYNADVGFSNVGGFVDLHPFMNGFTVSGGMLFGDRQIDIVSTPTDELVVEVGDMQFTPEEVGSLIGQADFGAEALYAGIGWDSTTHGLSPVAFVVRAGVMVTDSPVISLRAEGGEAEEIPELQAILNDELAVEAQRLQSDFEDFRFYPVLSIGLGFGF